MTTFQKLFVAAIAFAGFGLAAASEANAQVVTYYRPRPILRPFVYNAAVTYPVAPVVSTPVVASYPAATAYYAPTTTYYAPSATTYVAPTTTYYAPATTTYVAPTVRTYYAPAVTTAPVTTYYPSSVPTVIYRSW
jgi:hypothetical protein